MKLGQLLLPLQILLRSKSKYQVRIFSILLFLLFYSTNLVGQWQQLKNRFGGHINCFIELDSISFMGTYNGVFASTDKGQNWSSVMNGPISVNTLIVLGKSIFAGTNGQGIFLSSNYGTSWTRMNIGLPKEDGYTDVKSMLVIDSTILAGLWDGMYLSEDTGKTWVQVQIGLTNSKINSLKAVKSKIYAGTDYGGVFVSENCGKTWKAINKGLENYSIKALTVIGSKLYAGSNNDGAYLLTEGSTKWISTKFGLGLSGIAITSMVNDGKQIYAGTQEGGVFLLSENGSCWNSINEGLSNTHINSLAIFGKMLYTCTNGAKVWSLPIKIPN